MAFGYRSSTGLSQLKYAAVVYLAASAPSQAVQINKDIEMLHLASETVQVQLVDDIGAAERIEAADKLRTLTQEIPSAACHLNNGVEVEASRRLLAEAQAQFDTNLNALANGDESMNIIGAETRTKTLREIDSFSKHWLSTNNAVSAILSDPQDQPALNLIYTEQEKLFGEAAHLVSEISGEYSNPVELLQMDALWLDISGRQAMLTQKIASEACQIWSGHRSDAHIEALNESTQMFELGINALTNGMPELGLIAAPTPEIKTLLKDVVADWAMVKSDLAEILSGTGVSEETKADLYKRLNEKQYKLDKVVHLFTAFAKHKNS